MIDTHVHLLDPRRYPYPERTAGYRPAADEAGNLADLQGAMAAQGIERAVLVQPSVYGFDNAAVLDAVAAMPERFRGVAVVPANRSEIKKAAGLPGLAGIRLNLTDFKGEAIDARRFEEVLQAAEAAGFLVEVLAPSRQLAAFSPLIRNSAAAVIIDHMGAPDVAEGPKGQDFSEVLQLAGNPRVHMKLSGAFRHVDEEAPWPSLQPYVAAILERFAPGQLLWGSDWPFIGLGGRAKPGYAAPLDWLRDAVGSDTITRMNETALRLFGFEFGSAKHG